MNERVSAAMASLRIVYELVKSIGWKLVPAGTSFERLPVEIEFPDLDVVRANLFFLDHALLNAVREYLELNETQAAWELLSAYEAFRFYMSRPPIMRNFLFQIIAIFRNIPPITRGVTADAALPAGAEPPKPSGKVRRGPKSDDDDRIKEIYDSHASEFAPRMLSGEAGKSIAMDFYPLAFGDGEINELKRRKIERFVRDMRNGKFWKSSETEKSPAKTRNKSRDDESPRSKSKA